MHALRGFALRKAAIGAGDHVLPADRAREIDDALGHEAVEFRTHVLNSQSRRAIERLGARFEGILRANQIARDGTLRDTAVYSIVRAEWPAVRSHLTWQLERPRAAD